MRCSAGVTRVGVGKLMPSGHTQACRIVSVLRAQSSVHDAAGVGVYSKREPDLSGRVKSEGLDNRTALRKR